MPVDGAARDTRRIDDRKSAARLKCNGLFFVEGVGFNCNGDVIGFIDTPQVSPDDSYQRKPIKAMKST